MRLEKIPSEGQPDIARFGEVMDSDTVQLMQRAADELNLTLPAEKYRVIAGSESYFRPDGTRLPEGKQRIIVMGQWLKTGDIEELWDRVDELRSEEVK